MTEVKYTYYPNGQLASEWIEINGKREGVFKTYHLNNSNIAELFDISKNTDKNLHICTISYYVDGKINGEFKSYYKNGQISSICSYTDDKIQGEYKKYYSDGQLEKICNYIDGEEEKKITQNLFNT
jgi:antitoxin component YwqK of YwqJK toxin-antitoxin module